MFPKRILILHNRYREAGGEDHAFEQEAALLRAHGHQVIEYVDSNERIDDSRPLAAGLEAIWSAATVTRLERLLRETRPDVAHFHNTFLVISPAAYYACRRAGVPVVQTLHNFRLGCLNACCAVDGHPCELCVSRTIAWPGIARACYRGSRAASALVASIGVVHKALGTFEREVDAYISLSEFARQIHLRSGIPADRSYVKSNFAADPGPPVKRSATPGYALFAARMVEEKGPRIALDAWKHMATWNIPVTLKLAGDGPLLDALQTEYGAIPGVEFLGAVPRARVLELMAGADFLVHPSLLFENCGLSVIEAFSAGLPAVVSGHGSFVELVDNGCNGLHFRPGDPLDLARAAGWLLEHPGDRLSMADHARRAYLHRFSPESNYEQLLAIYAAAVRQAPDHRAA